MASQPATTDIHAPVAGVKPHLQPWEIVAWSPEQLTSMYSDWSQYLSRQLRYSQSLKCVNNALDLDPTNTRALLRRSQILRKMGRAPEALKDCHLAEDVLMTTKQPVRKSTVSLEFCDALYESNRLEDSKIRLHNHLRQFSKAHGLPVVNRLHVVDQNFQDILSEDTTMAVQHLINRMMVKKSKEPKEVKGDCDVVSILEKEPIHVSPLEKARRQRHFKIYNQTYLKRCWLDVAFLKRLRNDQNVMPKHCKQSKFVGSVIEDNYKTVRTLTKMLHTQCPLYAQHRLRYPNEALYTKQQEENLYRIQYQTRRNMFKILRSIRQFIRVGDLEKLSTFVDEVTGDYTTIKTNRVMPWKFVFLNEVFNYLGLARINEYKIPSTMTVLQGRQRLLTLFRLPTDKMELKVPTQPTTMNIVRNDITDPTAEKFKNRVARLENRMRFAEFAIERAYLLHEIAQVHLDNNSFDAACSLARKAADEASHCKSMVWRFLSLMVACKAHAILGKIEREKEILALAFELAKRMKNLDLCLFIDICMKVNGEEMDMKRLVSNDLSSMR
ncbi:hypothetical protein KR018_000314, partial [Drosophila ironensis]